jgi:hypothetical protein
MPRPTRALPAGPRKRPPAPELPADPQRRAYMRYITSHITLRELAEEFKGQRGCSIDRLYHLSGEEGWYEKRQEHQSQIAERALGIVGDEQAKRDARYLLAMRNSIVILDGLVSNVHAEIERLNDLRARGQLTALDGAIITRTLSSAARNLTLGQVAAIQMERVLGTTEGNEWREFSATVDALWEEVEVARKEQIRRAEERVDLAQAEVMEARPVKGRKVGAR